MSSSWRDKFVAVVNLGCHNAIESRCEVKVASVSWRENSKIWFDNFCLQWPFCLIEMSISLVHIFSLDFEAKKQTHWPYIIKVSRRHANEKKWSTIQLQISNDVPFTYQSHSMPQNMILLRDKVVVYLLHAIHVVLKIWTLDVRRTKELFAFIFFLYPFVCGFVMSSLIFVYNLNYMEYRRLNRLYSGTCVHSYS